MSRRSSTCFKTQRRRIEGNREQGAAGYVQEVARCDVRRLIGVSQKRLNPLAGEVDNRELGAVWPGDREEDRLTAREHERVDMVFAGARRRQLLRFTAGGWNAH